jgi:hypothetical protein
MSKRIKISNYKQDDKNFNKHTEAGMELLEKSIKKVGIIESFTVSDDEVIISGNARQEIMNKVLGEDIEPIIIETDGTKPIILKRTDIKSGTKEFTQAAILANTTAKKNINLDHKLIQEVAVEEFDIDIEQVGIEEVEVTNFRQFEEPTEPEYDLNTVKDKYDTYLNNNIKQIVLYFEEMDYKSVLERLQAIANKYDLKDNSNVVLKLLEFYEQYN